MTQAVARPRQQRPSPQVAARPPEVSILIPCLNEADTIGACVAESLAALSRHGLDGEVLVADNGSQDGSAGLAEAAGARVVEIAAPGYGSALRGGIDAARGRYVVMGDADGSYDFAQAAEFVTALRAGSQLVIGNRFRGGIEHGAMPILHRWLGTPVLTALNRLLFQTPVGDVNCGLRAFDRAAVQDLDLRTTGMEFASEMIIKASIFGLRVTEIPTVLRPDRRSRRPHLHTWRDGWRHLRFMLLYSPRWTFLYPGGVLFATGMLAMLWLVPGGHRVGPFGFDVHTMLVAATAGLVGYQVIVFAVFTKVYSTRQGLHPAQPALERLYRYVNLEVGLLCGLLMGTLGMLLLGAAAWHWGEVGFQGLDTRGTMRVVIPAVTLIALGAQTVFASLFLSILGIDHAPAARRPDADHKH